MSFTSRRKKMESIIEEISQEYKKASYWLPFDAVQIKDVFSEKDLNTLQEFIDDIENCTNENERKAKLINKIEKYSVVVIKGLELAKIL